MLWFADPQPGTQEDFQVPEFGVRFEPAAWAETGKGQVVRTICLKEVTWSLKLETIKDLSLKGGRPSPVLRDDASEKDNIYNTEQM